MKKAIIVAGGVQHLVSEGDKVLINYLGDIKTIDFTPIMIVDGQNSIVDETKLKATKVSGKIIEELQGDKVVSLRYKAKKRVNTKRGHRQKFSHVEITSIK
jgi:large subunit ribosomal protein L21